MQDSPGTGRARLRRVVVLSDTHFGEPGALLAEPRVVEALLEELEGLGEVDLLVLLGDIWDLWRTGLREAHLAGAHFLRTLARRGGVRQIVLVPGNHDHHLAVTCTEEVLYAGLEWHILPFYRCETRGDCRVFEPEGGGPPPFPLSCHLSVDGLILHLVYPFLSLEVGGADVLLMHGHHLDFFSRSFWWAKTAWLARWVLGGSRGVALSDIDRLNRPFFEMLTGTAVVPEIRRLEYGAYRMLRLLARLLRFHAGKGRSPRRYTTVGENAHEAARLLSGLLPGYLPDVFVFGHTHRAGLDRLQVGGRALLLANAGCWLEEESGSPCTYLVLDEAVRLRRLSDWEIARDLASLKHGSGGRPPS